MATEPPPPVLADDAATAVRPASVGPQPSLAARHARALYRPVPPVGYDDEGHPESDSAAVESLTHEKLRTYAVGALRSRYAAQAGFLAAADLGLLFERGNPAAVMAPDLLVSFGAGDHARSSYKLWQEPVPDLVMELLSPKTWRRDVEAKPALYEALGVREFWLFDPIGKLPRAINGWRLVAVGAYAPIPALPDGACRSAVLGLDLVEHGDGFRFRDPKTGELLRDLPESDEALRASEEALRASEEARRETEAAHRETSKALREAQARLAELEALRRQP